ncbi:thioesterase II family protein [Burkholderia stagnalis]
MTSLQGSPPLLKLFCLPYAGGSAAVYRRWQAGSPEWLKIVPLHMPGRAQRQAMKPIHQWQPLVDLLLDDVRTHLDQPFAIFGHSMGALIGFELAHAIRDRYDRTPVWFGASACRAPSRRERELHWLSCPEAEFLDEVRSLKGMPDELIDNREFMQLVLPFLRADFHLCGSYEYVRRTPLACPLLAIGGTEDEEIAANPLDLDAWKTETSGAFERKDVAAGHFFINTHHETVIDLALGSLAQAFRAHLQSRALAHRSYA